MNKLMTIAATCVFGFMASTALAGNMDTGENAMKDDMKSSMAHGDMEKDKMSHKMEGDGMAKDAMDMKDHGETMDHNKKPMQDEMKDHMKDSKMKKADQ